MSHTPATAAAVICRSWKGVEIDMRPADGYVNATAMCQAHGKHLPHYLANKQTKEYAAALSRSVGIPTDLLIQSITTGPNELRGTWIHPRMAIDLARWLCPEFAVMMDGFILDWMQGRLIPAPAPALPRPASTDSLALQEASTRLVFGDLNWTQWEALGRPERIARALLGVVHEVSLRPATEHDLTLIKSYTAELATQRPRSSWLRRPNATVSRECEHCGTLFMAKSASARMCSARCRVAASRARRAQQQTILI